jgi:hypothetical protein
MVCTVASETVQHWILHGHRTVLLARVGHHSERALCLVPNNRKLRSEYVRDLTVQG